VLGKRGRRSIKRMTIPATLVRAACRVKTKPLSPNLYFCIISEVFQLTFQFLVAPYITFQPFEAETRLHVI
jgi:hypothetical protein